MLELLHNGLQRGQEMNAENVDAKALPPGRRLCVGSLMT